MDQTKYNNTIQFSSTTNCSLQNYHTVESTPLKNCLIINKQHNILEMFEHLLKKLKTMLFNLLHNKVCKK